MKRILMGAALLAMMLPGCQNEDIVDEGSGLFRLKATKALNTRTVTDADGNVYWSRGDRLLVYGNGAWGTLTLEADDAGKTSGTFSGMITGEPENLKYAIYGDAARNQNIVSIDYDGYTYPNSNSPMKGIISDGKVDMEHLYGMVRLQILNLPRTKSTLVLKGSGIAGTAIWNGINFTAESLSDVITVEIPAGKRDATTIIDVPVFVSASSVNLTVELNGYAYKKAGETGAATSIKTNLRVGALNVSNMPKMEVKGNLLTEATSWSEDAENQEDLVEETAGVYLIKNAEQLAVLAQMVNEGNTFAGKTVKLNANIDLLSKEWTPIGISESKPFKGVFDGQDYTISNVKINSTSRSGLFGYVSSSGANTGSIKNLKVHNADVKTTSGAVVCGNLNRGEISGIELTGKVTVEGTAQNLAGVVGYHYADVSDIVVNVSADSYVKSTTGYCAGVAGYSGEGNFVKENITSNINVTGAGEAVGGVFVLLQYGNSVSDVLCSGDVTNIAPTVSNNQYIRTGGIAGCWAENAGTKTTITNCKYTGKITASRADGLTASLLPHDGLVGLSYSTNGTGELDIDGKKYVDVYTTATLGAAVTKEDFTIFMSAGPWNNGASITSYKMPTSISAGITIEGVKEAILDVTGENGSGFKNVTFKGISIKEDNTDYNGIQHSENLKYVDCNIEGQIFSYSSNAVFEGCVFNQTSANAYNIWTYGSDNITFTDCTFYSAGKSVLIYNEGGTGHTVQTATFENCQFYASAPVDGKAAIEIDSNLLKESQKFIVNIDKKTTSEGFSNGNVSGNPLWNNKKGSKTTIYVNNKQVL